MSIINWETSPQCLSAVIRRPNTLGDTWNSSFKNKTFMTWFCSATKVLLEKYIRKYYTVERTLSSCFFLSHPLPCGTNRVLTSCPGCRSHLWLVVTHPSFTSWTKCGVSQYLHFVSAPHLFNTPLPVSVPGLDLLALSSPALKISVLLLWSITWCSGSGPYLSKTLPPDWHLTSGISYLWSWFQVIYLSDPSLIVLVPSPTFSEHLPSVFVTCRTPDFLSLYQVLSLWSITFCLATRFSPLEPLTTCSEHVWSYFCDQLCPAVVPLIT